MIDNRVTADTLWVMTHATQIRALAAAVAAIAALALTSTALAGSPPKPVDPTIVVSESLGGVSVGQAQADAQAAWAVAPNCKNQLKTRVCDYGSTKRGTASILVSDGAVVIAEIQAPFRHGKFTFKGPLMDFGTTKGDLGLGDRLKSVAKRYPGAKEGFRSLVFSAHGTGMTFFAHRGRITQVILAKRGL